ncbi:hypothetical protein [Candidatus Nitrosotenuis sp. DW1]|uniref:hypothetical protein n=1 Tax=Candidatus Nitrosotenuis sp. DW1 TaxID=2259672 RepID=UPI0015C8C750|nr:hypothetical protein [Candidatus Nitrosotenuis sp. DW1]QLH08834.1 hypothetical protein DSQ19_04470 [Candidatus Nitrosotenuis sp. DW1]
MKYRSLVIFGLLFILMANHAHAESQIILGDKQKTMSIEVGKQVQITADLRNNQDIEQDFAYIVQIQNEDGVTVSLSWLTGKLIPAQSFSPALSWTPDETGEYVATIFVWESIDNPSALSPTLSLTLNVGPSV